MLPDYLLLVLWRQRFLILVSVVGCILLAAVYLLFATRVYTSTARMSVTVAGSPLTGQQRSMTDLGSESYLYTEQELILSPAVLALAAQSPEIKPYLQQPPVKFLQNGLDVSVGKHGTILSVGFSSKNPEAAARIANAVVAAYMAYQTRPKPADTAELERLAGERAKLDQTVSDKSKQMLALEQKYGVLTPSAGQGSLAERQLAELSQQLQAAHLDTLKVQSEYNQAEATAKSGSSSSANVDAPQALPIGPDQEALIRTEILQLNARLQDLRSHYLPDHPYIKSIERDLAQLHVVYSQALGRQYQVALQREKDLQVAVDAQQKQAIEVSAASAQYVRTQADLDAARKIIEQIDNRRREIEIARDLGMLNIDPFEKAVPSLKPSSPNKLLVLGVGVLMGLVLGTGCAFLYDWVDDRFRSIDEVPATTGLPLIGILPRVAEAAGTSITGQQVLLDPHSPAAESCRMIRTALHFGASADRRRIVLITSPASGEGKSTLAGNLAITMAQSGKRVLLIDADLRMPMQHQIFNATNENGLSSLLQGKATLEQAVESTEVDGLSLLPAGPQVHSPSEMLNSPLFTELLDMVLDRYDQVIVDSPPVVGLADARIIAASCDVTILVLRSGASTRRTTELACQGLASVGAQVLGTIVNDATDTEVGARAYYKGKPRPATQSVAAATQALSDVMD